MEREVTAAPEEVLAWSISNLRSVRLDPFSGSLVGSTGRLRQVAYPFTDGVMKDLSLRRTQGFAAACSPAELIWVKASDEDGHPLLIGIEPSYVYFRTSALVLPSLLRNPDLASVPLIEFVNSVLTELEALLKITVQGVCDEEDLPRRPPDDYLSLDHYRRSRLIVTGGRQALDGLERNIREYCPAFWESQQQMGVLVRYTLGIFLLPIQRWWHTSEVDQLEVGDLIVLMASPSSGGTVRVKANVAILARPFEKRTLEAYMELNDESVNLNFTTEDFETLVADTYHAKIPPHEQIELELYAGSTTIPFNDLCSVQAGTLIELNQSQLPVIELRVNGVPLLEGELVRFQDQLMVQVIRRLD